LRYADFRGVYAPYRLKQDCIGNAPARRRRNDDMKKAIPLLYSRTSRCHLGIANSIEVNPWL
jgi:hypothetical protein